MTTLTGYNYWANARIITAVLNAGEATADQLLKSSFPTIRKTLAHIFDAEHAWLKRIQGQTFTWPPSARFNGDFNEFFDFVLNNSKEFDLYISSFSENELGNYITYQTSKGEPFTNTVKDIVIHCMNHSTYHRGQLVTMLRTAGHNTFESLDYITYVRNPG